MGRGPGRGQGQGLKKETPRPGPLTGAGRGIEAGARRFRGPGGPVTNTTRTPLIVVEDEGPFDLAASTPLPATSHNPTAFAPATVAAAPVKRSGNAGWSGFPGPAA